MPIVENGIPIQVSGAWVGALNFEDYPEGAVADLADLDMTAYGELAANPENLEIADFTADPLPNNLEHALKLGAQNNNRWGLTFDAFVGLIGFGEVVILGKIQGASGFPAPAFNLEGDTAATMDAEYARAREQAGAIGVQALTVLNGSVTFHGSEFDSAVPWGDWAWIRMRVESTGGPNKRWRIKTWAGAYEDEPGAFQYDVTEASAIAGGLLGIGWGSEGIAGGGATNFSAVAFVGFSEDPDTVSTPGPTEVLGSGAIIPPTVTVTELQATFASFLSTAFTQVE